MVIRHRSMDNNPLRNDAMNLSLIKNVMIMVERGILLGVILLYPYVVFSQSLTQEDIVRQYDEYLKTISAVSYEFADSAEGGLSGKIKFDSKNQQFWSYMNLSKNSASETRISEDIALRVSCNGSEYIVLSSLKPVAKNVALTTSLHPLIFGYFSTQYGDFVSITSIMKSISFSVNQKKLGDRHFSYYLSGDHYKEKWELGFEVKSEKCFLTKIKYSRPVEGLAVGDVQSREIILEYLDTKQGTLFFPCKYIEKTTSMEARIYHDGQVEPFISTFNTDYSIYNVSIIPNDFIDSLQLSFNIPNYTPVSMQDAPQIQYVWIDG
ncbi:MAG: hypothetical protein LBC02_06435, partial [Planctomycetaceae bacterium]|nr:hypothetical protein [Planctomycetaceae bacterium]